MNSLSWMIYLADVAGNVNFVFGAAMIGGVVAGVGTFIYISGKTDLDNIYRNREDEKPCLKSGWQAARGFFIAAGIAALLSIPFPSTATIYAIAAMEPGA